METDRSGVLSRSAGSRQVAAPAGPAGVAVRERRRTIAIVAEWWSIEVLHGMMLTRAPVLRPLSR